MSPCLCGEKSLYTRSIVPVLVPTFVEFPRIKRTPGKEQAPEDSDQNEQPHAMPEGDVQVNGGKPVGVGGGQRVPEEVKGDGPDDRPENTHKITMSHGKTPFRK